MSASAPALVPTAAPQTARPESRALRLAIFAYGLLCYGVFFLTFLYAAGFLGNVLVPKSIDSSPVGPLVPSVLTNLGLLTLFALQHSVMARPGFKRWWTKFVPEPAERSTYVLFSSVALIALFWFWRPMGLVVWSIEHPALRALMYGVLALGFGIVLVSTFLINHFDLFGLRQVWLFLRGKPYTHLPFKTPLFYKRVRHPLYVGWLLAFWATPTMTLAHLLFALVTTVYILVAIQLEEQDLLEIHGEEYAAYRKRVPMLAPKLKAAV